MKRISENQNNIYNIELNNGMTPGYTLTRNSNIKVNIDENEVNKHLEVSKILTKIVFDSEIYLRDIEKLGKRVLIVMDNARFHRKNVLEKIIKGTGHCLLFLPPYSPDLNPIEKLWANMKKKLKDIAHNFNTLEEAVTSVLFNKLVQF